MILLVAVVTPGAGSDKALAKKTAQAEEPGAEFRWRTRNTSGEIDSTFYAPKK
jgi:hypothetical protein